MNEDIYEGQTSTVIEDTAEKQCLFLCRPRLEGAEILKRLTRLPTEIARTEQPDIILMFKCRRWTA